MKNRFLKEKLIFSLIFNTWEKKKIRELYKTMNEQNKELKEKEKKYEEKIRKIYSKKRKMFSDKILIFFKRLIGLRKEKAVMLNDNGEVEKIINLVPTKNTFKYSDNQYCIERKNVTSKLVLQRILERETFYFYNINCVSPLKITNPINSEHMTPDAFYSIMNTSHLIKLNQATSNFLSSILDGNGKYIIFIIIGIIIYLITKGG